VLDVGAGFETVLLRDRFGEDNVDVLGLWVPRFAPGGGGEHFPVDLNEVDEGLPRMGPYGLVVAAEVIEHLERGPRTVLSALAGLLEPGGRLVLQTPNVAALHKRLRLLAGRAPFDPMPEDRSGEGHVREYTARELVDAAAAAGLGHMETIYANYAGGGRARDALARAGRWMPRSLRLGLTLVFQREPGST
jgi:SAM-dependent methyltransferase